MAAAAILIAAALGLSLAMMGAWVIQKRTGNGGWVDVTWTFSTATAAVFAALLSQPGEAPGGRALLVAGMAALWGLRLGSHLLRRTPGHPDQRYAWFRKEWGAAYDARMFRFLQAQAGAGFLLVVGVWLAARNPAPFAGLLDFAGVGVFLGALLGGWIADRQLSAFKRDPANKGKVNDNGLWGWSRHPNYFFEWLVWLGYGLIAIDPTGQAPWGALALLAPAFMLFLLTRVSGVPPLEAHMERTRGRAWADYKARTSVFVPLPPKPAPEGAESR